MNKRRFAFVVTALPAVAFALWWIGLAESPPEREPPVDYSAQALDAKAGLYRLAGGDVGLLTFSAVGALRFFRISDRRFASQNVLATRFDPATGASFRWYRGASQPIRSVRFETDLTGAVRGFQWTGDAGERGFIPRVSDPPYVVRQIEWQNGDVTLSGTALVPVGAGSHRGAVLIHGSGNSHRDNLWYVLLASALAERGIATLLPDKRGTGRSGGAWRLASFADFAHDALSGREALSAETQIDPARIGLVGVSQGGSWIAPVAANLEPRLPFVVNLVGAAVTPNEQLAHEIRQDLRNSGLPRSLEPLVHPLAVAVPKRRRNVWWRKNGDLDPIPLWRQAKPPVLVIYGRDDERDNVPVAASVARLSDIAGTKRNLQIHVIEDVGHGLYRPSTRALDTALLDLLPMWILEQTQKEGPDS